MKKKSNSKSAFFNLRVLIGLFVVLAGVFLALIGFGLYPGASVLAQRPGQQQPQQWQPHWVVVHSSHNDISAPLREMATWPLPPAREHEAPENPMIGIVRASGSRPDTVVQHKFINTLLGNIVPGLSFDGIPFPGVVCNCAPPDTDGYVGLTQYVQIVNEGYQVFDKATGNSVLGPASIRSVWAGFGGVCQTAGNGDPVVLYDKMANRWLISQFATISASFPNQECIAVSTTSDATGSYNRYQFDLRPFGAAAYDYPHLGSWPDAYYMSMNIFNLTGTAFLGVEPFAFDRTSMLAGLPATVISPGLVGSPPDFEDPLLPSDLDGKMLPPAGAPNVFVEFPDTTGNNGGNYRYWQYSVGVPFGTNPTFTQFTGPTAAPFTLLCVGTRSCVPQMGTTSKLDGIGDRLMFRLAYRNFGSPEAPNESWVGNFSVSSGGVAAPRWFELKNLGGPSGTIFQESTYQPDSTWRWMGSVAMDQAGNLAIGFSASSATIFPQIHYAFRRSTDPLGTLTGEIDAFNGTGSQAGTNSRWGDYSAMTVDPVDDCTFWYTQEYYATPNVSFAWRTHIVNFKFDSCGGGGGTPTPTPTASPSATPTATATATPTASPSCTPGFSPGGNLPFAGVRFAGAFYSANGKFYAMGGRDASDVEFTNPFEYDPMTNMWTTKSANYPDASTNNMACGVLTDSGTAYIYCVGGNNFATQTETSRVFRYDTVTDTISVVAAPWPPGDANTLPGGFTVFNNKLYILGGFDVGNGVGTDQIWEFTPPSTWVQKNTHLPVPLGYIPTTAIGSLIYTGGGADITGGALTDTTNSFKYDPVADNSITTITDIPRATSNTRAVNFNGKMWVLGGGFPTPSNEVDIYDPVLNSWSLGPPMLTARRNAAMDSDGTNHIWAAGGYDDTGVANITTEVLNQCGTPSPTPTATATATATASATATATATPTPILTPRPSPTPRPRPTPPPRP